MNVSMLHGLNSVAVNYRPGDFAFLMARPCTPVPPTPSYYSKTAIKRRKPEQKTRAQRMAETQSAYLATLSHDTWTTRAEICAKLNRSTSAVQERMQMLLDDGLVLHKVETTRKGMTGFYKLVYNSQVIACRSTKLNRINDVRATTID